MKISNNCKNCNKEYVAETRELNRGNGMFCSRKCSGEFKSKNTEPLNPNVKCSICSINFHAKESRINKNTSGIFYCCRDHQIQGSKLGLHKSGPKEGYIPRNQSKTPLRLCNFSHMYGCKKRTRSLTGSCRPCKKRNNIDRWLDGDIEVTWSSNSLEPKSFVKQYLLENRGDKCESCGYDKKRPDGSSKIQMDHIDGDYTNNLISNLRLLCPNCHEDTPTFGSRNSGGGRRYRLTKMDK